MVKSSDQLPSNRVPTTNGRQLASLDLSPLSATLTPIMALGQTGSAMNRGRGRSRPNRRRNEVRTRLVDAALATLISSGFAGASVRTIAATGGFSPALVFYHFGTIDALFVAALDRVSTARLERYETRLKNVSSVVSLSEALQELYVEDLQLGQLSAVQEIVGGLGFDSEMGPQIVKRMEPWVTFAEGLASRIIANSSLAGFVEPSCIGLATIALYLGLEIVARMQGGDSRGATAFLATIVAAAPFIDGLLGTTTTRQSHQLEHVPVE